MILKEEGDSYEGFPGLSSTTPFATLSEAGWYASETSGKRLCWRIEGFIAFTDFQVR